MYIYAPTVYNKDTFAIVMPIKPTVDFVVAVVVVNQFLHLCLPAFVCCLALILFASVKGSVCFSLEGISNIQEFVFQPFTKLML